MASYITALGILLWPLNLIVLYICSLAGCVLGAIPGLSGGLGIILIRPVIFALDTNLSFAMLVGMYVGGVSGSFISAVLTGIPGSAASAGTCYDGYPMTKKGKAGRALSISITASFIGTVASVTVATLCAGFIAKLGLILGPWEDVYKRQEGESYLKPFTAAYYMARMLISILFIQNFRKR